jgi:hypothetical protein
VKLHADIRLVSTIRVHGIHLISSTSLHGEAHTWTTHERLCLRFTSWGEPRYFPIYWATLRSKLESGTFTVLCPWIHPTICKLYVELRSSQLQIWFGLNMINILEIAHHLRICQTKRFERVFIVIIFTYSLVSLERASRINWTLIWYFMIHSIHTVSLKLFKCKLTQYIVRNKSQLTVHKMYRKLRWNYFYENCA